MPFLHENKTYPNLARALLDQCWVNPETTWVHFRAKRNVPVALMQACAEALAPCLLRHKPDALMTAAESGWLFAPFLAELVGARYIMYAGTSPINGASTLTVPSASLDYKPQKYYLLPPPEGIRRYAFVDDFAEKGLTAEAFYHHAQEQYRMECVGMAFLLEIAGGGAREKLRELLGRPYSIWFLAQIETGRYEKKREGECT